MTQPAEQVNGLYRKAPITTEKHEMQGGTVIYDGAWTNCPFCGDVVDFEYDHYGVGMPKPTDCPHIVDNDSDYGVFLDGMTPELWQFFKSLRSTGRAILDGESPAVYGVGCNPMRPGAYLVRRAHNGDFDHIWGRDMLRHFTDKVDAAWYCVEDAIRLRKAVV